MSNSIVRNVLENAGDQASLRYLVNPNYNSTAGAISNKSIDSNEIEQFRIDKKFYRKRILAITKQLFRKNNIPDHINELHNNYIKQLVEYFKITDKTDIVQEEYNDMTDDELNDATSDNIDSTQTVSNANKEIFNINEPVPTMEKYISIKKVSNNNIVPPKKKDIDLKNPKLRTKGISSKEKKKKKILEDK